MDSTVEYPEYTYRGRDLVLKDMGYSDYQAYLKSDLWEGIRGLILYGSPECVACFRPAEQVHHLAYDRNTLEGNALERLAPVCRTCHYVAEFDCYGEKRVLRGANEALATICRSNRKDASKLTSNRKYTTFSGVVRKRQPAQRKRNPVREYSCVRCKKKFTLAASRSRTACPGCKKKSTLRRIK